MPFAFLKSLTIPIPWPVTKTKGYACLLGPTDEQATVHLKINGLMSVGNRTRNTELCIWVLTHSNEPSFHNLYFIYCTLHVCYQCVQEL